MTVDVKLVQLCAKADLGEGEIKKVEKDGLELAVYCVEGEYFVTSDHCTHGPGSLSEGFLDGHVIECDFHNGAFDIRSGEVVAPPCMIPLKTYKVVPDDNAVVIDLTED